MTVNNLNLNLELLSVDSGRRAALPGDTSQVVPPMHILRAASRNSSDFLRDGSGGGARPSSEFQRDGGSSGSFVPRISVDSGRRTSLPGDAGQGVAPMHILRAAAKSDSFVSTGSVHSGGSGGGRRSSDFQRDGGSSGSFAPRISVDKGRRASLPGDTYGAVPPQNILRAAAQVQGAITT